MTLPSTVSFVVLYKSIGKTSNLFENTCCTTATVSFQENHKLLVGTTCKHQLSKNTVTEAATISP